MKSENQQVNLELSQQLKEAGYPQEGLWWWDLIRKKEDCDVGDKPEDEWILSYEECYQGDRDDLIVAPTVAELGEALPRTIKIKDEDYNLVIVKNLNELKYEAEVGYSAWDILIKITADTEANARAKMWLYLKKENLL